VFVFCFVNFSVTVSSGLVCFCADLTLLFVAAVDLAMMKKPVGEYRTPTDLWAGLGFSKSMPDAEIRDWLDKSLCYRGSGMSTTYEVLDS